VHNHRYAVLFGASSNSLKEEGAAVNNKDWTGPGGYFTRRIVKMLKTENFNKSVLNPKIQEKTYIDLILQVFPT
jgi:hypothetical protein